jgi:hypothetical protein
VAEGEGEIKLAVNKITWAQVGLVTEPGRYMFKFGWLTITADDLAVWKQFPSAVFTLYDTATPRPADETEEQREKCSVRQPAFYREHELLLLEASAIKITLDPPYCF